MERIWPNDSLGSLAVRHSAPAGEYYPVQFPFVESENLEWLELTEMANWPFVAMSVLHRGKYLVLPTSTLHSLELFIQSLSTSLLKAIMKPVSSHLLAVVPDSNHMLHKKSLCSCHS